MKRLSSMGEVVLAEEEEDEALVLEEEAVTDGAGEPRRSVGGTCEAVSLPRADSTC